MVVRIGLGIGAVLLVAIAAWLLLPFDANDRKLGPLRLFGVADRGGP